MPDVGIGISTRIIYESLGSKNIEVDSIVFAEQIKNAYDAHSKKVTLDFSNYKNDKIIIYDSGHGMNYNEILNDWLLIGTKNKMKDPNYSGGKGIGRLSLFRIADKISVISKKNNEPEYQFCVDMSILKKHDTVNDLKVNILKNVCPLFFNNELYGLNGTIIILEKLKSINLKEIYEELYNLNNPNIKEKPINIKYILPNDFEKPKIMDVNEATKYAPFKCFIKFKGKKIIDYDFECKLSDKIFYKKTGSDDLINNFNGLPDINLGEITFNLYNFYFNKKFIYISKEIKDRLTNEFLNIYQGISIYRKNFKIYGHGKNDWLKLAEKRVESPSHVIDNKLTFGTIDLLRPYSDRLEEKTSREGFIKNEYLNYFTGAINLIINQFEKDRDESKINLKKDKFVMDTNKKDNDEQEAKNENDTRKDNDEQEAKNENDTRKDNDDEEAKNENDTKKDNDDEEAKNENNTQKDNQQKGTKINNRLIIDESYICNKRVALKIKQIIIELQHITSKYIYAQSLLLRCLLDISTQYAQVKLDGKVKRNKDDLLGNIRNMLNYISNNNAISNNFTSRMYDQIKKQKIINYFNGVAHEYNYRPDFETLKTIWDTFEEYITYCSNL